MDDFPHLQCHLPTELLRQIVIDYASSERQAGDQASQPRHSYKPPWSAIQPLTLASKVLRELALEAWFEVYYAHSPDDLLHVWPMFSSWTRELHCVELGTDLQDPVLQDPWDMQSFHRLRKLRIDFDPAKSNAALLQRFKCLSVQELELYDISWPSPRTLQLVAQAFPSLRSLKLSQDLVWCNLCNICRFATFKDPPPAEIVYDKIVGLPAPYVTYLKPLSKLQSVTISIGYSLGGTTSLSKHNDNLWTGECDACMDMMYPLDDFREEWVDEKKAAQRLPALKSVKWQFRHKSLGDVVVDLEGDPIPADAGLLESDTDSGPPNGSEGDD